MARDTVPAAEVRRLLHDLNGHLQPIAGYAELLSEGLLPREKERDALLAIGRAAGALGERLRVAREELLLRPDPGEPE